jgi:ribosomal protein S18 acetylase RimI-like enzyme
MALNETKKRNVTTVLLNAPTQSQTAKECLKTIPCTFLITEYQMKWKKTELIDDPSVIIRPSFSKEDKEAEIQLDVAGFGMNEDEARKFNEMVTEYSYDHQLIIEMNGKIAGKIRVSEHNGEAWIYGFVVLPEFRGKGIGKKALSKVVNMEHQKGLPVFLEVEAKNAHALRLYESCGFQNYHSQDYYEYLQGEHVEGTTA